MAKAKNKVDFEQGAVCIDAAVIGEGLGVDAEHVQPLMREGRITSLVERGIDKDAGLHRLTLFFGKRRFRLLVDDRGQILERSTAGGGLSKK